MTHFSHPLSCVCARGGYDGKICHHLSSVIRYASFCTLLPRARRPDMTYRIFLGIDSTRAAPTPSSTTRATCLTQST